MQQGLAMTHGETTNGGARAPVLRLLERQPVVACRLAASLAESYLSLLSELQALAQHNGMQRLAGCIRVEGRVITILDRARLAGLAA
jgi:hypothetical protein